MADWKLFSSTRSPFVRKVLMAAAELGMADRIERENVVTNPMTPDKTVFAVNPLGQIPTLLLGDGEMLCGSAEILDFFDNETGGSKLYPSNGSTRREVLQRQALGDGGLEKAVKWLDETFQQPNEDTKARITGYRTALNALLDMFEQMVAEWSRPEPDAGDITIYCLLSYLDFRFDQLAWQTKRPTLTAWHSNMAKRNSAKQTEYSTN